jgi:succinate dehydrogenase hydrophobic anchor subunit
MVYPFFMPIRISLLKMMAASHSATEESFDSISSAWAQMISTLVTCRYTTHGRICAAVIAQQTVRSDVLKLKALPLLRAVDEKNG